MGRGEWALALILGAVIVLALIEALAPAMLVPLDGTPNTTFFHYQSLIGALLALAGAGLGAWFLYRQIRQTAELEEQRRRRRREAIRSMLPLSLSTITRYATDCAVTAQILHEQCQGEALPRQGLNIPDMPAIPMDALAELKELSEHLDDDDEVRFVSQIPRVIQYQAGRLDDTVSALRTPRRRHRVIVKANIEQHMLDAAEVYARTEALFDWARREVDDMPAGTSWDRVQSAMFIMRLWGDEEDSLRALVKRRSEGKVYLDDR